MPGLWDRMRGKTGYQETPLGKETPQGKVTAVDRMEEMRQNLKRSRNSSRYKSSDEFERVYDCLKDLNTISGWNATDINRGMLEEAHKALGDACKKYLESKAGARTGRGRERYAMVEEIYRLQLDEKRDLGKKSVMDAAVYHGTPWKDVLHGSRILEASTPANKEVVGGAISARVAVKANGKDGFFTQENKKLADLVAVSYNERLSILADDIKDENIKTIVKDNLAEFRAPEFGLDHVGFQGYQEFSDKAKKNFENAVDTVLGDRLTARDKGKVVEALIDMGKISSAAYTLDMARDTAMIAGDEDNGLRLNNRNIASSRVAALLDNGDLIARSDRMKLDGEVEGSFMEFAKGEDLSKLGKKGGEKLAGATNFRDPRFLRQIQNLAIMDYVMGQVDRHPCNMFYEVDENNAITGIQGIDNDMSFGCREDGRGPRGFLADLDQITVVDRELKDSLQTIDRTVIDYELSDLLNENEREMLARRIENMNRHLSDPSKVTVIEPDEWLPEHADNLTFYYTNVVSQIRLEQELYQKSVRTPVQESELAQAEKQAPAGDGAQKQAPAAQASRTPNTRAVLDNDLDNSEKQTGQQAAPKAQPKTPNTRTVLDNDLDNSEKQTGQQAAPKAQPKTANTRTVLDNDLDNSEKQTGQQAAPKAQPKTANTRAAIDNDLDNVEPSHQPQTWKKTQPKGRQQVRPNAQPSRQSVEIGSRGK